ncbi:MAG: hypothetical protein CMI30_13060 [Opitutae bacterium]|nr:hypothetical protein [Opitutae bacterium]|tara:strand:- start:614 stop:838 length:225 start_codon:yes stop_codon:yes gene_type:complete
MTLPARLNAEEASKILGFEKHDISVLVRNKLLRPLGKPSKQSTKFFAMVEILKCREDVKWLDRATKVVSSERRG